MVRSLRCVPISKEKFPKLLAAEWVAPNCTIIGDVEVGKYSSFFHGVVLRGDTSKIIIGQKTIIQDNTIIENSNPEDKNGNIIIGDKVVIGVNCTIDKCRIDDNALISNGVTIHNNCHIQAGAMVAAGAVLPPNTVVPTGQIFAGNPAIYLRDIRPEEIVNISSNSTELRELANVMVENTERTHFEIVKDAMDRYKESTMTMEERHFIRRQVYGYSQPGVAHDDFGLEALNEGIDSFEQEGLRSYNMEKTFEKETYDQYYEMDMSNYPDVFKIQGENFKKYDDLRKRFENEIPGETVFTDSNIPKRAGAMRAWINKWDPDYNVHFKTVQHRHENTYQF